MRARVASAKTRLGELEKALEDAETPEDVADIEKEINDLNAPPERDEEGRIKFTAKTQPRDAQGKFRTILARLKQNLGTSGNQRALEKVQEVENLDSAGNYAGAVKASTDLIDIIDRLDDGALNADSISNVRASTTELGKVIANLPLPFENQAQKIRFSDMPAELKDLTKSLIERVEDKLGAEDAAEATAELRGFMTGSDYFSQGEISSQLNRMLRLLT